ncbi:MAG TPA: hypothetical protein VNO30_05205 [Kofleriaceae bacterium]|nr:hypothetical protein [Kofleriaceae bacterium]
MSFVKVSVVLCCVVLPAIASAQVFPPDSEFIPLRCDDVSMQDGFADQSGALDERDIVGDAGAPAGLRAVDDTYLYLRLRLEEDPAPAGAIRPFSWGMQFDTDGDLGTYEVMVLADGTAGGAGTVSLFSNRTTMVRNDPNDPADQPAAKTYPFAMNARTLPAPGSSYGGTADYFLDIAVPWSDLAQVGLDRDTNTFVWAASSSTANSLNGDFACHDGASGPARLDAIASDPTTGDPTRDPNGGGGGGGGTGRLEGGGGCAAGGGAGGGAGAGAGASAVLALLSLLSLRRRDRARRGAARS